MEEKKEENCSRRIEKKAACLAANSAIITPTHSLTPLISSRLTFHGREFLQPLGLSLRATMHQPTLYTGEKYFPLRETHWRYLFDSDSRAHGVQSIRVCFGNTDLLHRNFTSCDRVCWRTTETTVLFRSRLTSA